MFRECIASLRPLPSLGPLFWAARDLFASCPLGRRQSQVEGHVARTIGFTVSRRSCDLGLAYCFQLSLLTQSRRKLLRCFSNVGLRCAH